MSRCLGIDADDEFVTRICRQFRGQQVYPRLTQSLQTTLLGGVAATRTNALAVLGSGGTRLITGSGHGFAERFTGQGQLSVLEVGQYNPLEVTGAIVHLLSCNTAQQLGPDLVANGCTAFFGYDDEFVFPDQAAALFLDADSQIDLTLAGGGTAQEAYDAAILVFDRHIRRMLQTGNVFIAAALKRNRDHLCAPSTDPRWGDRNARLT
jgi:hypothetical protein